MFHLDSNVLFYQKFKVLYLFSDVINSELCILCRWSRLYFDKYRVEKILNRILCVPFPI